MYKSVLRCLRKCLLALSSMKAYRVHSAPVKFHNASQVGIARDTLEYTLDFWIDLILLVGCSENF